MNTVDSGIEYINVELPGLKADIDTVENVLGEYDSDYGVEAVRLSEEDRDYLDLAADCVESLIEGAGIGAEDVRGISLSSMENDNAQVSVVHSILNDQRGYDFSLQGDDSSTGETTALNNALNSHFTRHDDDEYLVVVSSGAGYPDEEVPEGSAAVGYLIGGDPSVELSETVQMQGISPNGRPSFDEQLEDLGIALNGFIEAATEFEFPGTQVTGNNSDLVHPENVNYAVLDFPEIGQRKVAAARGFGRLMREQDEWDPTFDIEPEKRDPDTYLQNIMDMEEFQDFYERAVKDGLELRRDIGVVEPVGVGLQRASFYNNEMQDETLSMVGETGKGGRVAEVHAEKTEGDVPVAVQEGNPEIISEEKLTEILEG